MRCSLRASRLVAVALAATLLATVPFASAGATNQPVASGARDVFAFGHASFFGSTGTRRISHSIVGISATPKGRGYWLVASDGGVFGFGNAHYLGSTGGAHLNRPIVGMASTPTGHGYWLVASDGGMFSFGDARFHGSAAAVAHGRRIVGIATTPTGRGYWIASSTGNVFAYGDANPFVTRPARVGNQAIVGIAVSVTHRGFWLAADGMGGPKVEAAINWFQSRIGSSAFEERCETAVETAYGTISRYASARSDWLAQPDKHLDWWNAPRGALVFYDTSADGHVAISLGDGNVVSTSVNHRIAIAPIGFFQNPLGWTTEPW
jgi:hypothetical protein